MKTRNKLLLVLSVSSLAIYVGYSTFVIYTSKTQNAVVIKKEDLKPVCYLESDPNVFYTTIEAGLKVANKSNSDETVYVVPGTNPTITTQCSVNSNVTLTIPYEGTVYENSKTGTAEDYNVTFSDNNPSVFRKNQVKVNKTIDKYGNVVPTIIVQAGGTINIAGFRGQAIVQGGTCGQYTELYLEDGALIDCYGSIYCMGFIKESVDNNGSQINIYSGGIITEPLVVYDWSSASSALAAKEKKVFPFNYYDLPQISPILKIYAGGELKASARIYGSSVGDNITEAIIIGSSNSKALIKFSDISAKNYIIWKNTDFTSKENNITKTDSKHIVDVDIFANCSLDSLEISITRFGYTTTIKSADFMLPFSNFYNINLNNGSIFNVNYDVKFLPGSRMTIMNGATANLNGNVAVYSSFKNSEGKSIYKYNKSMKEATFINNGELNVNKNFGGKIQTNSYGNSDSKIITQELSIPLTTHEMNTTSDSIEFLLNPLADVSVSEGEPYQENYMLESKLIYKYTSKDLEYYRTIRELYIVNLIRKETPKENHVFSEFNFDCEVTHDSGTVEIINKPGKMSLIYGESFEIINSSNIDSIIYNGEVILDFKGRLFIITTSGFDIIINPTEIAPSKIKSIEIAHSDDGISGRTNENIPQLTGDKTLFFSAVVTTTNPNIHYHLGTSFKWSISGSETIENGGNEVTYSYDFTQGEEDKNWKVNLRVIDGIDNTKIISNSLDVSMKASSCFLANTLISLADRSIKKIEDIKKDDIILAINHETGEFEQSKILSLIKHKKADITVIKLGFANGECLEIVSNHELLELETLKYVEINPNNVSSFIGKEFATCINGAKGRTHLISYDIYTTYDYCYAILSYNNLNAIANNLISMTPTIKGTHNYFEMNEDLKYDEAKMKTDIQKYGLFTYADFKEYILVDVFNGFNVKYLKVAIGKEIVTYKEIQGYIKYWYSLIENGEME